MEVRASGSFDRAQSGGEERDVVAGHEAAVAAIEATTGNEGGSGRKA